MQTRIAEQLGEMQAGIAGQLREVETRSAEQLREMETRFEMRIERVETTLLTEFHKWASPAEARARTRAAVLRVTDLEMEQLSHRVKALEDRKAS
ncbi:MAG: hypothetical protein IT165_35695 [Bryobacterales bacterium]|nr:hypothetical protein [Bryobacterales bacterium]